jgi:hypothetical protein
MHVSEDDLGADVPAIGHGGDTFAAQGPANLIDRR